MIRPADLAILASTLETKAGASTTANTNPAGYWRRIALAAEALAGASTTAAPGTLGYMRRAALALEAKTGTSGSGNPSAEGYLRRMVNALESKTSITAGSIVQRLKTAASAYNPVSANYVANGTFTDATGITLDPDLQIATGVLSTTALLAATRVAAQTSSIALTAGTYRIVYTLSGRSAGGVRARVGGTYGAVRTANATQSQDLVVASVTDQLIVVEFAAGTNAGASVDDLTITKIA